MIIKNLKKIELFQEDGTGLDNARLFLILIRHRKIEFISDGIKLIEGKVIKLKILTFRVFMKKYNLKIRYFE